ncbi:MAG TPA: glycosyltransferase [Gaiellaceae bacterium]|nr:glycosyltransferase [Gaiellaceae bacterium]
MISRSGLTRLLAYTDADTWGGAEASLAAMLAELDDRYELALAGTSPSVLDRILGARPNAEVRFLPAYGGKFDLGSLWAHVRAFRQLAPRICLINLRTPASCQAGIFAALLTPGTRIVAVEHLPIHGRSAFVRWSRRQATRFYAAHVAVGEASARAIEGQLGLTEGAVRVIHNGVAPFEYAFSPVHPQPVIGTLGRLVSQKGHDVLVQALLHLPGVRAVIAGEGPLRDDLERLAAEVGVADRLELSGWSNDVPATLRSFDAFVLPSRLEGLPLVVLEAMLAGVPVVASDVGSVREAIDDGVSGLLVPPDDPPALAAAVQRLLQDPDLRAGIASSAREVAAASFTATTMAARYAQLFEEVTA